MVFFPFTAQNVLYPRDTTPKWKCILRNDVAFAGRQSEREIEEERESESEKTQRFNSNY